jgi:hypothetical protein
MSPRPSFLVALFVYLHQKGVDRELAVRQINATEASDRLKGFEKFQDMQRRYNDDKAIGRVLHDLQLPKEPACASISDKHVFTGFFEELAIMINSGILSPDFGYWTIGLDAATFYDKETSWREDRTWALFNSFAQKAKARYHEISKTEIAGLKF